MFDTLVISGGGIKGFSALGAIHFFYDKGMLENIKTYCGCSIGSVLCLLLNCGYSPLEILSRLSNIDLMHLMKVNNLFKVLENFGFVDIDDFATQIDILVRKKFDTIPTLNELYNMTHKKLIVSVTNTTKRIVEYLDYENSPNLSCMDAIKMSSNLPLIFQRLSYNECLYADGGLLDNFPILHVDVLSGWNDKNTILGIKTSIDQIQENTIDNFPSYLYRLLFLSIGELEKIRLGMISNRCYIITVPVETTKIIDFAMTNDDKKEMFSNGYRWAKSMWTEHPYNENEWI